MQIEFPFRDERQMEFTFVASVELQTRYQNLFDHQMKEVILRSLIKAFFEQTLDKSTKPV